MNLESLLQQVAEGSLSPDDAAEQLRRHGTRDLGFATIDTDRQRRRAFPDRALHRLVPDGRGGFDVRPLGAAGAR